MIQKKFVFFVACFFLLTGYAGCKKGGESSAPSTGPGTPSPHPSIGIVDEAAGFYLRLDPPDNVSFTIHKVVSDLTDFSKPCEVPRNASATADKDILCLIDGDELDFYFHGLKFYYNVPSEMCDYVIDETYYYYAYEPGQGPTAVSYTVGADGKIVSTSLVTTPAAGGLAYVDANGSLQCKYDHTPEDGPNCCYGNYVATIRDANNVVTTVNKKWSGKAGNCAAGAVNGAVKRAKDSNLPIGTIHDVFKTGLNFGVTIEAPAKNPTSLLVGFVNFFDPADHVATGGVPEPFLFSQTVPAGVNPAPPASPYYTLTCTDDAEELRYRIRFMVREWNLQSEFLKGGAGNPDTVGLEPVWGNEIDDYYDWRDLVQNPNNWSFSYPWIGIAK